MTIKNSFKQLPNEKGYFGSFGGRYVSETLMPLILEVEKEYNKIKRDNDFTKELDHYMNQSMDLHLTLQGKIIYQFRATLPLLLVVLLKGIFQLKN